MFSSSIFVVVISSDFVLIFQIQKVQKTSRQLHNLSPMSGRNIMAAILQTKGPVVTPRVVKNVWKFLHMMTSTQFDKAANELQVLNLGKFVMIKVKRGRTSPVFVKRSPAEVGTVLAMNEDLCTLSYYESRYNQSVSKSVTLSVRAQLASLGLVAAKQLR